MNIKIKLLKFLNKNNYAENTNPATQQPIITMKHKVEITKAILGQVSL